METLQARREWQKIFQAMRTRGLQPTLLYPARLSIKIQGQIRSFPDKRSLKEYLHQTSFARDAKGAAVRKGRKREKERRTQVEIKAMNNDLSIITLNVNELNAPIKRHRVVKWIRQQDPHICCLQETYHRTK